MRFVSPCAAVLDTTANMDSAPSGKLQAEYVKGEVFGWPSLIGGLVTRFISTCRRTENSRAPTDAKKIPRMSG